MPATSSIPVAPSAASTAPAAAEGNELLTDLAGGALIVLLAALGLTIVAIGRLLWLHLFIGLALAGPLALKMASTGYRFVRYYTGDAVYRRKGPPPLALRLIAPVVVVSTLVVMVTGVWLLLAGPGTRASLLPIHKISFFVWIAFTAPHVLAHLPALWRGLNVDLGARRTSFFGPDGRAGRLLSLGSALAAGALLAFLLIPDYGAWIHAQTLREHLHVR